MRFQRIQETHKELVDVKISLRDKTLFQSCNRFSPSSIVFSYCLNLINYLIHELSFFFRTQMVFDEISENNLTDQS